MPIDIASRRKTDANRQLDNLLRILGEWKTAANKELPQHNSQITSAHAILKAVIDRLQKNKPPLTPEKYSRLILSAHRIWDFFQSKFAQRRSSGNTAFLEVADQLAYDCYKDVGKFVKKAPPLVILTGASQPYVQKRDSKFAVEGVATQETLVDIAGAATANLPFPVLGVPWSQSAQLEGLVAIGHEVGHAVEDDLGLTPVLSSVFAANCKIEHKANWTRWQREMFADVWGCFSTGPAFVYGLADHIAPTSPWKEPVDATAIYPPAWLRIRFNREVVRQLANPAFPAEVEQALTDWCDLFPVDDAAAAHLDDIPGIVAALFNSAFPGLGKLGEAAVLGKDLKFTTADYADAMKLAKTWLPVTPGATALPPAVVTRMPVAAAALRLAYEAAPAYDNLPKKMIALKKLVHNDVRAGNDPAGPRHASKLVEWLMAD